MENASKLITSIIEISFDNLPIGEGWTSYELDTYALRKMIEINAFYMQDDKKKSFNPKYQGQVDRAHDLTFLFMDLRQNMYESSPEQGAWYSCKIVVYPNGKFDDDIKAFPREESLIPDWLKKIINS